MSEVRKSKNGTFVTIELTKPQSYAITRRGNVLAVIYEGGSLEFVHAVIGEKFEPSELTELASFISELRGEKGEVERATELLRKCYEVTERECSKETYSMSIELLNKELQNFLNPNQ